MTLRDLARTVDERLADLSWAEYTTQTYLGTAKDQVRSLAGQERIRGRRGWEWAGTYEEAAAATVSKWDAERFAKALAEVDRLGATLAQIDIEIAELSACYRDYYWNRAFLVKASNGHVHKSQDCSTCFDTTEFAWLPELSGADEDEIVEAAGETACTICYPSAPAEVLNRPTTILTADRLAKEAARAAREAAKAEREAKRRAKAPTASGEPLRLPSEWSDRWEEIQTERTAISEWYSAQDMIGWRGGDYPRAAERQRLIEEALAGKHGVTPEEKRAELAAKYAKRK